MIYSYDAVIKLYTVWINYHLDLRKKIDQNVDLEKSDIVLYSCQNEIKYNLHFHDWTNWLESCFPWRQLYIVLCW